MVARLNDRTQRGVSLIEALVALAIMAFGLLGVAAMQSSLRATADVSRQRAEAVRMAQQKIEELRGFAVLSGAPSGQLDYDDVVSGSDAPAPPSGYENTTFARTWTVTPPGTSAPAFKIVTVTVSWNDRSGTAESVTLATNITRASPELSASMGLRGDRSATRLPRGRNPAIPPQAVDAGNGTSTFAPPGTSGVTWTFDNITGVITSVSTAPDLCTTSSVAAPRPRCFVLWGYVRFVDAGAPPTGADAELPSGSAISGVGVAVQKTVPAPTGADPDICYTSSSSTRVSYFCLVRGTDTSVPFWTGDDATVRITGLSSLASTTGSTESNRFKVCRYTPERLHVPTNGNDDNPYKFVDVNRSLGNKNYLLIRAGDDTISYGCPTDDTSTPLVNGNTCPHQPATPTTWTTGSPQPPCT